MEQGAETSTQSSHWRLSAAERRSVLAAGDFLLLLACLALSLWLADVVGARSLASGLGRRSDALTLLLLLVAWLGLALIQGAYDLQVALSPRRSLGVVLRTTAAATAVFLAAFFLLSRPIFGFGLAEVGWGRLLTGDDLALPRVGPALFLLSSTVALAAWRQLFARASAGAQLRRRALVVGAGRAGQSFLRELSKVPHHYELLGLIDDDPAKAGAVIEGLAVLGGSGVLSATTRELGVDDVIVAVTRELEPPLFRALLATYEQGVAVRPMPAVYEETLDRVPVEHLGQRWFLAPFWGSLGSPGLQGASKRLVDLALSGAGLLVTALLFPFLALAIRLDSAGPILYAQERLGLSGRPFWLYKLRTMGTDAEEAGKAVWAQPNDPRVTRVGRFLRRTRLDELPQLWNVFRGEMSLVGPRPERPQMVHDLEREIPFYRLRLAVKPGLTGWAQINAPYASSAADALIKLQYDLYYIKRQSLLLDALILLRTLGVVVHLRGL